MFAKCQGVATLAIALVLAGADRARGQGFRVLPNQPFVNNAAFFMNPGLAQARFLSGLQGQAVVNSLSNPFGAGGLGAAALANPYTSGAIGSASLANPYVPAGANYGSAYSPYGYPPYYSDPLMGAADVLRSYGDVVNAQEKARILREAAKQSRLETAKKRFDTERYIQDNTPTFTEEQAKVTAQVLKRLQSTSNPFEIHSGASLNIMLDDLKKNMSKRVVLGAINLPDNVLLHINVTTGPGNLGLLRDGGRFKWPPALQETLPADKQRQIDLYADTLVNKARNGKVEGHVLGDLKAELERTTELLSKKMNELSTPQYTEAKRFLRDFADAAQAIERGDTVPYFEFQAFMSKAPTLEAVVEYMASKGLKFAPATQGDEAAYQAMHSALAAYDVAWNAQLSSPTPPAAAKD